MFNNVNVLFSFAQVKRNLLIWKKEDCIAYRLDEHIAHFLLWIPVDQSLPQIFQENFVMIQNFRDLVKNFIHQCTVDKFARF